MTAPYAIELRLCHEGVGSRVTAVGCALCAVPPDRRARVGGVEAERSGPNRGGEVLGEIGSVLADLGEDSLDGEGHVHPRALGHRSRTPVAAAEADGTGELIGDRLHLSPRP